MTEHKNLAAALSAFQAEMPAVHKGKTAKVPTKNGGSYSYDYADLADVSAAAMPLLTSHGLSFITRPEAAERGWQLTGVLMHTSGESLEGSLPISGNSPQEMGSSLTYMRRYLMGCLTGIVTDADDDGQVAAQGQQQAREATQRRAARQDTRQQAGRAQAPAQDTGEAMSDGARKTLFALMDKHPELAEDQAQRDFLTDTLRVYDPQRGKVESRGEMTEAETQQVINRLRAWEQGNTAAAWTPFGGAA